MHLFGDFSFSKLPLTQLLLSQNGGVLSIMVIIVGNEISDPSSTLQEGYEHFTYCYYSCEKYESKYSSPAMDK